MVSAHELQAIEERARAATSGLEAHPGSGTLWRGGQWYADVLQTEDLVFWREARGDVLTLLAELCRLRRRMAEVEHQLSLIETEEGSVATMCKLVAMDLLTAP